MQISSFMFITEQCLYQNYIPMYCVSAKLYQLNLLGLSLFFKTLGMKIIQHLIFCIGLYWECAIQI